MPHIKKSFSTAHMPSIVTGFPAHCACRIDILLLEFSYKPIPVVTCFDSHVPEESSLKIDQTSILETALSPAENDCRTCGRYDTTIGMDPPHKAVAHANLAPHQ